MSPLKHTLAVLRTGLSLGQKEMAEVAGCSKATIQAVELGKLKMSDDLARRVSLATGVSLSWLLDGDVKAPPRGHHEEPFTKAYVDNYLATRFAEKEFPAMHVEAVKWLFEQQVCELAGLIYSACKQGQAALMGYRLTSSLKDLHKEFGGAKIYLEHQKELTRQRRAGEPVCLDPLLAEFDKLRRPSDQKVPPERPKSQPKTNRKPAQG